MSAPTDQQRIEAMLDIQGTRYCRTTCLITGKVRVQAGPENWWTFNPDGGFSDEPLEGLR